ncbi:MAG: SDR family NAD(P)-dependent oxidoreductase [Allosphingosinicella sp.]|uniref:SDR family NAD(P)-dependent oxidoreductase n=1 Tax=Allosphingosinicella sp. TaxID=2823234 RepID=UPI0039549C05
MNDFAGAHILVTGAASGIGAAAARHLAGRGASLVLMDRRPVDGFDGARLLTGDVADPAFWAEADLGGLTHAVANAGVASGGPIADLDFAEWRRVMAVNLDGAFLTLQAAMRAIRATGRGGAIVLTASAAGLKAEPGIAAYAASKAALLQLGRVAAKEGAADRIRVNAIAPGGVETPIWTDAPFFQDMVRDLGGADAAFAAMAGMATPLGRFAAADEIARQIAFLLSDDAAFMTGATLVSDGGYSI